jgi:hypothetical protein
MLAVTPGVIVSCKVQLNYLDADQVHARAPAQPQEKDTLWLMVDEEVLDRVHPDVDVHLSQTAIKHRSDDEKDNAPKVIKDADVDRG